MTDTLKLPPMPERISKLPRNARGYPVPYFVAWIDGLPDFRLANPEKLVEALAQNRCWICGDPMGVNKSFVIGPMCTANRVSAEPPSHRECAEFAVQACPFMLRSNMERREDDRSREMESNVAGHMIKRNPGVTAIWTTRGYDLEPDQNGKPLFRLSQEPTHVSWWREGRQAHFGEVRASIESGAPILLAMCESDVERGQCAAAVKDAISLALRTT